MTVTRSSAADRARVSRYRVTSHRGAELLWLCIMAGIVTTGLVLIYLAKANGFADINAGLGSRTLLNLNDLSAREDLLPALSILPDPAERQMAAGKIYSMAGTLPNVGAIARIEVSRAEVQRSRGLTTLRTRFQTTQRDSVPLFTAEEVRLLKPLFVVRRPTTFRLHLL